jgi:hypothetical protein
MKHIGFTGTQNGMTADQRLAFINVVVSARPAVFHHGDCIGADAQAHEIVEEHTAAVIVVHPPINPSKRAFCEGDEVRPPKDYLKRNEDIVLACDELIACPKSMSEELRSGTWATVRCAVRRFRSVIVVWPDGSVTLNWKP